MKVTQYKIIQYLNSKYGEPRPPHQGILTWKYGPETTHFMFMIYTGTVIIHGLKESEYFATPLMGVIGPQTFFSELHRLPEPIPYGT